MQIEIREAEYLKSKPIRDLWQDIYNKRLHNKWWEWLLDFDGTRGYVAFENNKPIGMICTMLRNMVYVEYMNTAFMHNGGMHPNYRGKGIYGKIYDFMVEEERKRNYFIQVGFGNPTVLPMYLRHGAIILTNIIVLSKDLTKSRIPSIPASNIDIKRPDLELVRNQDWLRERYLNNPRSSYKIFGIKNKFIITKKFGDKYQVIHAQVNPRYLGIYLDHAETYARDEGCSAIEIFLSENALELLKVPLDNGYKKTGIIYPVHAHFNWHMDEKITTNIQIGDNDVF